MPMNEVIYGSAEYEQLRKERERERFRAEINGWAPAPPKDVRPKDIPFVMCGMCNTYPARWNAAGWRCSKIQYTVEPGHEACERWTPREDWKPDPPMLCYITERPGYDIGVPRLYEPLLPNPDQEAEAPRTFVYFIRCGEFVKIGFSSSPQNRRASIATSSPLPVDFIGLIEGSEATERSLHKQFKHLRHKLEWFLLTEELSLEIKRLCGSERKWKQLLKECS